MFRAETLSGIRDLQEVCYGNSVRAGWWEGISIDQRGIFAEKIALCHSELTETLEGFRKDLMDEHLPHRKMAEVELADLIIRAMDLAGACGYDLAGAIAEKLAYNLNRADHKPEARAATNGKKF